MTKTSTTNQRATAGHRGRRLVAGVLGAAGLTTAAVLGTALPASAHAPHHVDLGNGDEQVVANGRNHGAVVVSGGLAIFCLENTGEPLSGAMYGIETAHHGPDAGTPGMDDGCYATTAPVSDGNPALD